MRATDRRTLLKGLALAGSAAATGAVPAAGARGEAGPAGRDGHALRHHALHRLQGVRVRLPAGQRPRAGAFADGLHLAPVDLDGRTKNVIKLYRRTAGAPS